MAAVLTGLHPGQKERWRATLGSHTSPTPVVVGEHIYVGSNSDHGFLGKDPSNVVHGALLCLRKSDGQFLWQHASEKLATGRADDWPKIANNSRPFVEDERPWYVTDRAEIVCLDTMGFRDGENDGSVQDERLSDVNDADVVWQLDLMKQLGVRPQSISTCTVGVWNDRILVVTGNGIGAPHLPPLGDAPRISCVDKTTGKLLWQDDSPDQGKLRGRQGSPGPVGFRPGERKQVIFPGGYGWLYRSDPQASSKGNSEPNTFQDIETFIATGRDSKHDGAHGRIWGMHAFGSGEAHPGSRAIWHFEQRDANGNGKTEAQERTSLSLGTTVIKKALLFVTDVEGVLHCINHVSGKQERCELSWQAVGEHCNE